MSHVRRDKITTRPRDFYDVDLSRPLKMSTDSDSSQPSTPDIQVIELTHLEPCFLQDNFLNDRCDKFDKALSEERSFYDRVRYYTSEFDLLHF